VRRAWLAVVAAAIGTAGLVAAKTPLVAGHGADIVATGALDPGAGATDAPAGGPESPAPGPTSTARPSTKASAPGHSASPTRKPTATKSSAAPAPATRSFNGSRERAGNYGYVRVKITVSGTKMTAITMLEVTSNPNRAARQAPAVLIQEALAAQSADIANVSQATYTSDAFKASLRSALAQV
jgi:uncharacterized protein with FMN-binding domain